MESRGSDALTSQERVSFVVGSGSSSQTLVVGSLG